MRRNGRKCRKKFLPFSWVFGVFFFIIFFYVFEIWWDTLALIFLSDFYLKFDNLCGFVDLQEILVVCNFLEIDFSSHFLAAFLSLF